MEAGLLAFLLDLFLELLLQDGQWYLALAESRHHGVANEHVEHLAVLFLDLFGVGRYRQRQHTCAGFFLFYLHRSAFLWKK